MTMKELKKMFDIIQLDNHSGSADILKQIVIALKYYLSNAPPSKPRDVEEMIDLLNTIIITHENYMVVTHFVYQWLNEANKHLNGAEFNQQMLDFTDFYTYYWMNTAEKIAHRFTDSVNTAGKSVLTLSNSKTLHDVFSALTNEAKPSNVIQLESRPAYEGRLQAAKLAELGYNVTLITDAAAAIKMKDIDLIVSGADSIHENHFINKTGTFQLALLASYFNKPLHVLTDSRKINQTCKLESNISHKQYPGNEIWQNAPDTINIENFYFEPIPNILVTSFITERKTIFPEDLIDKTVEA